MAIVTRILIVLFLLTTTVTALEYKPGKKHPNKEGVIGLLLYLNGKMIEHVFKPNLSACMKSKRVAQRVQFACKVLVADLEEDTQTKYGFRITKVHSGN